MTAVEHFSHGYCVYNDVFTSSQTNSPPTWSHVDWKTLPKTSGVKPGFFMLALYILWISTLSESVIVCNSVIRAWSMTIQVSMHTLNLVCLCACKTKIM